MKKIAAILGSAILLMSLSGFAGDKKKDQKDQEKTKSQESQKEQKSSPQKDQYADLKFQVLRDWNGKPVRNASIVLHTVDKEGKQEKGGGLELKTDADGKTAINTIPFGKMRIQVIARGFQTFGDDFVINKLEQEIVIKLKRPQEQYSIYK